MRVQLALNVSNLEESIEFYEKMFATPVLKVKPGYANFAIENPPLKLVLFEAPDAGGTLNHLGVEVENAEQVEAAEKRLTDEGIETTGVDDTVCCYAAKTETWVESASADNRWEWYVKTGDTTEESGGTTDCCAPSGETIDCAITPASADESSCC